MRVLDSLWARGADGSVRNPFGLTAMVATGGLLLAASCGQNGSATPTAVVDKSTGADLDASANSSDASPTSSPAVLPDCSAKKRVAVDQPWTAEIQGVQRTFSVHLPPNYDPTQPIPVLLHFYGYQFTGLLEEWLTSLSKQADEKGYILVYPEGTGSPTSFNAGACCGDAPSRGVDDVAFTNAIIDRVERDLCVDPSRIYASGMSNGGFMSHRLGCELANRIAAIGPVAGVLGVKNCAPARPMPVIDFHGTADPTIPYDGDSKSGWPSAPDTAKGWADRDGCVGEPREVYNHGDTRCVRYETCRDRSEVELCTITGGGHSWPGGATVPPGYGATSQDVSANDLMWEFFLRHPLL